MKKTRDFLWRMVRKHQVTTLTLSFFFLYQLATVVFAQLSSPSSLLETSGLSIGPLVLILILLYLLQWIIAIWALSKLGPKTKERLYRHPIATIFVVLVFITDLPSRVLESGSFALINALETAVFYGFLSFLIWSLICWISEKIWRKSSAPWGWYKSAVDKASAFLPPAYKVILSILIAITIFMSLFAVLGGLFGYNAADWNQL